jgi:hypothetical protein
MDPAVMARRFAVVGQGEPDRAEAERAAELRRLVAELPPVEARVVEAYFFLGMKEREIAAELGVSQPAVSQRISRALKRLGIAWDQRQRAPTKSYIRLELRLTPGEQAALRELATREGSSMAAAVRNAVARRLEALAGRS